MPAFVSFADEIIVVDTGSKDDTKEIAARFTSKIYDFEWTDDFAAARNFAMSKAVKSYQLWVDADDRITPENQGHIESLKSLFDGKKAFYFILENHQTDAPPSSCQQLRCTPITGEVLFEGRIHEQIFPSAVRAGLQLVATDIVITHLGYMTEQIRIAKARRNLAIMERERAEGRDDGALHFFLAMTYAPLGRRVEAIRSMEEALERFEKENYNHHLIPEGYLFLARVSFEMEEHDRCLRYLAMAGSLVDGNPMHNFNMGILYQRLGRHSEALKVFKEVSRQKICAQSFPHPTAGQLTPSCSFTWPTVSCCMNDRQNALKLINASALQGPELGRSWEWLGTKAYMFKNIGFAQTAFETALRFGALEPPKLGAPGLDLQAARLFAKGARMPPARAGPECWNRGWTRINADDK